MNRDVAKIVADNFNFSNSPEGQEWSKKVQERIKSLIEGNKREEEIMFEYRKSPKDFVKIITGEVISQHVYGNSKSLKEYFPFIIEDFLQLVPSSKTRLTLIDERNIFLELEVPGNLPWLPGKNIEANVFLGKQKPLYFLAKEKHGFSGNMTKEYATNPFPFKGLTIPVIYEKREAKKSENVLSLTAADDLNQLESRTFFYTAFEESGFYPYETASGYQENILLKSHDPRFEEYNKLLQNIQEQAIREIPRPSVKL